MRSSGLRQASGFPVLVRVMRDPCSADAPCVQIDPAPILAQLHAGEANTDGAFAGSA